MNDRKPAEQVIMDATQHVMSIRSERMARETSLHADDERIATETAAQMFRLGRLRKAIEDQNQRWRDGLEKNVSMLKEIDGIYEDLSTELDVASKCILPKQ